MHFRAAWAARQPGLEDWRTSVRDRSVLDLPKKRVDSMGDCVKVHDKTMARVAGLSGQARQANGCLTI